MTHLPEFTHQAARVARPEGLLVLRLEAPDVAVRRVLEEVRAAGAVHREHGREAQRESLQRLGSGVRMSSAGLPAYNTWMCSVPGG